jgi:flavin-dependent dehydrogenase
MRDVVIVGGGPAGTVTALALAHFAPELAGRVVLLERARYPRDKPCAGALGSRGDVLLRGLGVDADVPGVPIEGVSFRGAEAEVHAAPGRIGRVIRRIDLDAALANAARSRGVEVREGVRVDAVTDSPAGPVVETSAGRMRGRVVVGCDGVGSVVRRALGLGAGRLRAQVLEVDTEPVRGDPDRSLLHFDASDHRLPGYAWDFPTLVDGRPLVCRGVYRLKLEGDPIDDVPDVSVFLSGRLRARGIDLSRCTNKRYAERGFESTGCLARGALMLVGEAAGIDPVTGEGIAQAIEYGVLAGRFLARNLASNSSAPFVEGWQDEVGSSRLAHDLRIRTRLVRLFYGPSRARMERFLTETSDALHVGCQHFAAQPYDGPRLVEALARFAAHLLGLGIDRALAR